MEVLEPPVGSVDKALALVSSPDRITATPPSTIDRRGRRDFQTPSGAVPGSDIQRVRWTSQNRPAARCRGCNVSQVGTNNQSGWGQLSAAVLAEQ